MQSIQQVERFKVLDELKQSDRDRKKESTYERKLINTVQRYYDLNKTTRPRLNYLRVMADLFAKGIHFVDFSPQRGIIEEWSADKISSCMYTPIPLLQYAVEVIAAQYATSSGKTVPVATDDSDPKTKAVVRSLQEYAEYLDWDFYHRDPHVRQREAKLIPLRGVYNFVEYDRKAGAKVELPQYMPTSDYMCQDCGAPAGPGGMNAGGQNLSMGGGPGGGYPGGYPGSNGNQSQGMLPGEPPPENPLCPNCGSPNTQEMLTGIQNVGTIIGRQGQVKRNVVDSFQVDIYDRRRGIEESKHLIYDEILFKSEAKKIYPWLIEVKGTASLGNYEQGFLGLHWLSQLQIIIANTGRLDQSQAEYMSSFGTSMVSSGYGGSVLNDMLCWRRRCWLDAEVYADWDPIDHPVQLPGTDQLVPAGTRTIDMYPDGMIVHILNGEQVIQCENQNKNKVWTYVHYRVPSAGHQGTGINSLISLVRGHDEATSISMQALLMAALGIVLIDERIEGFQNIPGRANTVPIDANPLGQPMSNFGARLDMGGGAVIAAAEPLKQQLRGAIGDLSMASNPYGTGLRPQGVGQDTATAVRYNAGATDTLTNPPMELYAAHRAKVIEQAIDLERQNNIRPRLYGKAGESTGRWLEPMDIPEDISFATADQSWRARTLDTRREDIMGALSVGVGTGTIADPQIEEEARRVFGLDEETDGYDDWLPLCERRLDAMKALAPQIEAQAQQIQMALAQSGQEMPVDPMTGAPAYDPVMTLIQMAEAQPRPLDMPGHQHYARFYSEEYQRDEFFEYPKVLQLAIEQLFQMHIQAQMMMSQVAAANSPEAQQQQAQDQANEGKAQAEDQRAQATSQREDEQSARQAERETKQAEGEHKRGVHMENLQHSHKMQQMRTQAKLRPRNSHTAKKGGKKK